MQFSEFVLDLVFLPKSEVNKVSKLIKFLNSKCTRFIEVKHSNSVNSMYKNVKIASIEEGLNIIVGTVN